MLVIRTFTYADFMLYFGSVCVCVCVCVCCYSKLLIKDRRSYIEEGYMGNKTQLCTNYFSIKFVKPKAK